MAKINIERKLLEKIIVGYLGECGIHVDHVCFSVKGDSEESFTTDIIAQTIINVCGEDSKLSMTIDSNTLEDAVKWAIPGINIESIDMVQGFRYTQRDAWPEFKGIDVNVSNIKNKEFMKK